jgi:dihydrofolate reductase/thymidylate synthase
MNKQINYILASSSNNVIGINNNLPWKIKEDIQYFYKLTINNMIIMGLNTFKLLNNKPLKDRLNIVITSTYEDYQNQPNLIFLSSLENAIYYGQINATINIIWIIGDLYLYEQIHQIKPDNIYITHIEIEIESENITSLSEQFFKYIEENYNSILIDTQYYFDNISKQELKCEYFHSTIINKEDHNNKDHNNKDHNNKEDNNKDHNNNKNYINTKQKNIIDTDYIYLQLVKNTLLYGNYRATRNDYTFSHFGSQIEFNMKNGFPLLTTKKMPFKMIFEELMFFINGYTDNKILKNKNIHIWNLNTTSEFINSNKKYYQSIFNFNELLEFELNENENELNENELNKNKIENKLLEEDDMGPMYGFQWRYFNAKYKCPSNEDNKIFYKNLGIDQLYKVINELLTDPFSRRILMTSFNPQQVDNGVLYPCHSIIIQFYCTLIKDNNLNVSIKMYQRSADLFLGLPFNIASTALLLYIICDYLNNKSNTFIYHPDRVIITLGDTHIYQYHINSVLTQLQNQSKEFPKLTIKINNYENITDYTFDDMVLENYNHCGIITAKMIA